MKNNISNTHINLNKAKALKVIAMITLCAFVFTTIGHEAAWALERYIPVPQEAPLVKDLNVNVFELPDKLGTVKDSWKDPLEIRIWS